MIPDGVFVGGLLVIALLLLFALHKLIKCPTNRLEWTDLVATNGYLNAYKIAFIVAFCVGTWVIIQQQYAGNLESGTLSLYFLFAGGTTAGMAAIGSRNSATPRPPDKPLSRGDPVID